MRRGDFTPRVFIQLRIIAGIGKAKLTDQQGCDASEIGKKAMAQELFAIVVLVIVVIIQTSVGKQIA